MLESLISVKYGRPSVSSAFDAPVYLSSTFDKIRYSRRICTEFGATGICWNYHWAVTVFTQLEVWPGQRSDAKVPPLQNVQIKPSESNRCFLVRFPDPLV